MSLDNTNKKAVVLYDAAGNALLGQKTMAESIPVAIASDQTLTTISGGDYWLTAVAAGKGHVAASVVITVSGTAEAPLFLFRNPNASGKTAKLRFLITSSGAAGTFRIYRDATITTNGTTITPRNLKKSGAASVMLPTSAPTISANGSLMETYAISTQASPFRQDLDLGWWVEANENLYITAQGANGQVYSVTIFWIEE